MISEIRSYLKAVIREVNTDLKSHNHTTISDNISDTQLENTYFINIGSASSGTINTDIETIFDVNVEIFKNGFNDAINNYDNGYCQAIDIQAKAMDQSRLLQDGFMKDVNSSGVDVDSISNNDNTYKYTIQFKITCSYKRK